MEKSENKSAFIEKSNNRYPILSIIIPVYNEEKNIEKCIRSILKQPYKDYEILIVDNHSTDHTLSICNRLQEENRNIFVCSELKRGVSAARNRGLKLAKGKYIMFIDGDDFLPSGILPLFMEKVGDGQDIIVQGNIVLEKCYLEMKQSKEMNQEVRRHSGYMQNITLYPAKYAGVENNWVLNSVYGVVGKVFPKKTITDLRFLEGVALGEDILFYLEALRRSGDIAVISDCVYVVNDHNTESSTRRINLKLADSVAVVTDRLVDLYDGSSAEVQENLYYQIFRHIEVGILGQIEKMSLQKSTAELTIYAKQYLKPKKNIYKEAYQVVLRKKFQEGVKKYILYYVPITLLEKEHYRLYCLYIRMKEKIKRYKNEHRQEID